MSTHVNPVDTAGTESVAPDTGAAKTFDSLNPRDGTVLATYPIEDADSVRAAVDRARVTAHWWAGLGFDGRSILLRRWAGLLARRMPELTEVVSGETGKPHSDAQLEIVLAVDHLNWAARHARRVLGPRHHSPGMMLANFSATLRYEPLGVIGVIGPQTPR